MKEIPTVLLLLCGTSCSISLVISTLAIYLQLANYRKPFEQRLIVRILLVVPIFAVSCFVSLVNYQVGLFLEPVREMYEAFVIYTFYKLLIFMLDGERAIIQNTQGREPTEHFFPAKLILGPIEISDPKQFLTIKRMILQYVWVKPLLYVAIWTCTLLGCYDTNDISLSSAYFWLGIIYNMSVSISLYYLALFWKCLYSDLMPFHPWPKFLCVKIIVFASYWQGIFVGTLNYFGIFHDTIPADKNPQSLNTGVVIQNALLCLEMVLFSWLHWTSFPYTDFDSKSLPDSARVKTWTAFKDFINISDLIYDLKLTTMYGDSYNFRKFDSVNDLSVYRKSRAFNKKIYQGLRVSHDGSKHWVSGVGPMPNSTIPLMKDYLPTSTPYMEGGAVGILHAQSGLGSEYSSVSNDKDGEMVSNELFENSDQSDDFSKDEKLYHYVKKHYITDKEINYPIVYDYRQIAYSHKITQMRTQLRARDAAGMV